MIDKILKWATPVLLLVLVFQSLSGGSQALGGTADNTSRFGSVDVTDDYTVDDTVVIDAARGGRFVSSTVSGASTFSGTVALNGAVTFGGDNCGSKSFTIIALSPRDSTVGAAHTTTTVNLTGASLGDKAIVSNNSSTNALAVYGVLQVAEITSVTGTNASATVLWFNTTRATSTAVTTSTLEVCYVE